jgi:uncharacterized membrane protein (Fun14 family)
MSRDNKDTKQEIKIENNQDTKQEDTKLELFGPMVKEISVGSVMGFCAGYFCRQALKGAMFIAGGAFIAFQGLSHLGYVNLNWKKLETDVTTSLDADNDGKLTTKDLNIHFRKFMRYLAFRVPSVGSFGVFFWMGLSGKFIA